MHRPRQVTLLVAVVLAAWWTQGASAAPVLTTLGPATPTGTAPVAVAFSPDGRLLATANLSGQSVSMFLVAGNGVLSSAGGSPFATGSPPNSLAFSPSGGLLATVSANSDSVSMFRVAENGTLSAAGLPAQTGDGPVELAFSPDGRFLATADRTERAVSIFSVSPIGALVSLGPPVATQESPNALAFSPTGGMLATAGWETGVVSLFAVSSTGQLTAVDASASTGGEARSMAFSPDGRLLATASGGYLSTFTASATDGLTPIAAPVPGVSAGTLAFRPDGNVLAVGSAGQILMFSVSSTGVLAHRGSTAASGTSLAFDPSGARLAVANEIGDHVSIFSVSVGGALTYVGKPEPTGDRPCSVQFSPGGGRLATANAGTNRLTEGSVSVFSVSLPLGPLPPYPPTTVPGRPCSVAFSPDGALLATTSGSVGEVTVFTVGFFGLTPFGDRPIAEDGSTDAVAFSPDGRLLASSSASGQRVTVYLVSREEGTAEPVASAPTGSDPMFVAFSPDGRLLVTANRGDDSLSVFSVKEGGELTPVGDPTPAGESPQSLTFNSTGDLLATTDDKSVRVFSVSSGGDLTPVGPPTFLSPAIWTAAAFSPTRRLLTAIADELLWLFAVAPSGELSPIGAPTLIPRSTSVAFSPDGSMIATANRDTDTVSTYPLEVPTLDTAITAAPPPATSATTAAFDFEPSYPSTLQCSLDSQPFVPCTTARSETYPGLAEGAHSFAVRATGLLGTSELSPATRTWTVDFTAPAAPSLAQPASGATHLRASQVFEWSTTTDNLTGVDRYELWLDGALRRTALPASCGATCAVTLAESLPHGSHSWQVRAFDGVGNEAVSASRSFSVDASPPATFALTGPADDAVTTSPRPALSWQAAVDDGVGIGGYDVVLDEQLAAAGMPADATAFTPPGDLADGVHRWRVVARDRYGHERTSATRQFTVDTTPPVATLTAAPNPALTTRSITFSAGGSSDAGSGIARIEWDLDGDGSFETDTGAERTAARSYAEPGTYAVSLRVSDRAGLSAIARTDQRITTTGATSQLGISINSGARYTRSPKVTITSTWPLFAIQMLVSNDGGFGMPATLPLNKQTPWTLDSSGAERSGRLVYVRFTRGLTTSETYIDDIILDERRPSVTSARMTASRSAGTPLLTIRARDRGLSGVSSVQITNNRRRPDAEFRAYRANIKLFQQPGHRRLDVRRRLYVRVRDRAGNASVWRPVKRTR
jgi:6-phosphogluconolactonase (cycloisomerase 2 family)